MRIEMHVFLLKMATGNTKLFNPYSYLRAENALFVADSYGWRLYEHGEKYKSAAQDYTPADLGLPMFVPIYVLKIRLIIKDYGVTNPLITTSDYRIFVWDFRECKSAREQSALDYITPFIQICAVLCVELPQPIFEEIAEAFF